MFDNLSDKLQRVFKNLRGEGKLTAENMEAALKEIRLALLEADVHFKVAKQFIEAVREKAMGQEVLTALSPNHSGSTGRFRGVLSQRFRCSCVRQSQTIRCLTPLLAEPMRQGMSLAR